MNEDIKNLLYELKGMLWALSGVRDSRTDSLLHNDFSDPLSDYAERIEEILGREQKNSFGDTVRKDIAGKIARDVEKTEWYHLVDGELVGGADGDDALYKANDIWNILDKYMEEEE